MIYDCYPHFADEGREAFKGVRSLPRVAWLLPGEAGAEGAAGSVCLPGHHALPELWIVDLASPYGPFSFYSAKLCLDLERQAYFTT